MSNLNDNCPDCVDLPKGNCWHFPASENDEEMLRTAFISYMTHDESVNWSINLARSVIDLTKYAEYVKCAFDEYRGAVNVIQKEHRLIHFIANVIRDAVETEDDETTHFPYSTYFAFAQLIVGHKKQKLSELRQFIREAFSYDDLLGNTSLFLDFLDKEQKLIDEIKEIIIPFDDMIKFAHSKNSTDPLYKNEILFALKLINNKFVEFCHNTQKKYEYNLIYRIITATRLFEDHYDVLDVADNIDEVRRGTFKFGH